MIRDFNEIFEQDERIGIRIRKDVAEDDYYKQTFYRLKDDFEFAFILKIKNEDVQDLFDGYTNVVHMGADSSSFNLKIEQFEKLFDDLFTNENKKNRIVCMSDTYLKSYENVCKKADFILGNTISFANIETDITDGKLKKRKKEYIFLEKGTVIYPAKDNYKDIINKIKNKSLEQIGYNKTNYFEEDKKNDRN